MIQVKDPRHVVLMLISTPKKILRRLLLLILILQVLLQKLLQMAGLIKMRQGVILTHHISTHLVDSI